MPGTLLAYSSVDGQTLRICSRLRQLLEAAGQSVTLFEITPASSIDLALFDVVVIGASVRYGKHRAEVIDFTRLHSTELGSKHCAFFSVNVVARKAGKNTPEGNAYLQAFLKRTGWNPPLLGVFAGRIDYPRYHFLDRHVIRLIMWITNGPTDLSSCTEFTDWKAVDKFASEVAKLGKS